MDQLLQGLRAAAEPTRLRVLVLCAHGELSVSDLTQILGQSQPRVSRHLKLLCDAGLLQRHREGTFAYFRLADDGPGGDLAQTLADLVDDSDSLMLADLARLESIKQARAERAAAYFRDNAPEWDEIRRLHIDEEQVEQAIIDLLPTGKIDTLVDLGTGTGRMLVIAADRAHRAIGIDWSREMLAVARTTLDRQGLRNCQVRHGDITALPIPSGTADVALMHQVLHYLEEPANAIAEAARVLKPGGHLIVADFAKHDLDTLREEHAHRWLGFELEEVNRWLDQAGFEAMGATNLPGEILTVVVWQARRREAAEVTPIGPIRRNVGAA
jgi:ArsR family transcriptional regulator